MTHTDNDYPYDWSVRLDRFGRRHAVRGEHCPDWFHRRWDEIDAARSDMCGYMIDQGYWEEV